MHVDKANAAYSVIGVAARLCFQARLHQQSIWRNYTPFETHMRQRIFWTVYFLDRRISLSCGRPYSLREADIDIEQPAYLYDKVRKTNPSLLHANLSQEIHPDQPLPSPNIAHSSSVYLNCMVCWGRLAADVWDGLFAATVVKDGISNDHRLMFDGRIKHWTEVVLPAIPLLSPEYPPEPRQLRQHTIVQNSLDQLRLLIFREALIGSQCDAEIANACRELAVKIVQRAKVHSSDVNEQTPFRFYMAASLGSAMVMLATSLVRDIAYVGLNEEAYNDANAILDDLATANFALARRIKRDFAEIETARQQIPSPTEFGFGNALGADLQDILPYTSLDFAQQSVAGAEATLSSGTFKGPSSASTLNTDLWSSEAAAREGRYGVPWI